MTYEIRENRDFNSREIFFDGKPSTKTREALKALKMRWHYAKKCWYGYASENAIISAICDSEANSEPEPAQVVTDGYMGGGAVYGNKSNQALYGADLSRAIRADIKAAGIKGVSVRCGKSTHTDHITVTLITEKSDIVPLAEYQRVFEISPSNPWIYIFDEGGKTECLPVETYYKLPTAAAQKNLKDQVARFQYEKEAKSECNVNHYHVEKYKAFSSDGMAKINKVLKIVESYRWDESNSMVDYFSTNFYFDIYTKPGKWADAEKE